MAVHQLKSFDRVKALHERLANPNVTPEERRVQWRAFFLAESRLEFPDLTEAERVDRIEGIIPELQEPTP